MAKHGGFRHNVQSLRVVEELELKYPQFNGLNLSWEVREGLRKPYVPNKLIDGFISPSLEAQLSSWDTWDLPEIMPVRTWFGGVRMGWRLRWD